MPNLANILVLFHNFPVFLETYFHDTTCYSIESLVELRDNIMFYLVIILFVVAWIMASIIRNYVKNRISNKYLNHGTLIELIWTVSPALILILIAFPSFKLLYLMDEVADPSLTLFAEGHQWYWSYEYTDFLSDDNEELEFDSFIAPESHYSLNLFSEGASSSENSSGDSSPDNSSSDAGSPQENPDDNGESNNNADTEPNNDANTLDQDDVPDVGQMALCEHPRWFAFPVSDPDTVQNQGCDGGGVSTNGTFTPHLAFNEGREHPLVCHDCSMVLCADCYTENYSDSASE